MERSVWSDERIADFRSEIFAALVAMYATMLVHTLS
jgi:hypothetical protein